jgi:hypothetical protein
MDVVSLGPFRVGSLLWQRRWTQDGLLREGSRFSKKTGRQNEPLPPGAYFLHDMWGHA